MKARLRGTHHSTDMDLTDDLWWLRRKRDDVTVTDLQDALDPTASPDLSVRDEVRRVAMYRD